VDLPIGQATFLAIVPLPDQRDLARLLAGGVLIDGVVDPVIAAAGEPGRPLQPARLVHRAFVGRVELEIEVADDSIPEPLRVGRCARQQLLECADPVRGMKRRRRLRSR